ncbi:hypothetical protein A3A40_01010 [Candidatus Kaiserbacteria bacterium RIFCSPLOWO2_01_FULL_54_20]|uniref:Peptidoglycan binding-like domain-containing protein n=1 Tax=Candidatus Kaiserbacteria bacterium RIFCSPLOWO2_01_FULL_54_20 TaxID=1798513 RepID=A0A1F6EJT1_9BACT|nr:MAG: hypothetical protein A3A40_01010 [Candidatus Kaiserbacteria bacterium RIFCSPLOWO2_01_FULL_54_20]
MKKLALIPAVVALLIGGAVSAQVYYPNYSYGTNPPAGQAGCVVLSSDLSFGSRGSEVTKLQQFLVSQNYPGGGSWMVTGYFGNATVQAVRNFQQSAGIPTTGFVDGQTRSAIQSRSCGSLGDGYLQNYFNYGSNVSPYLPTGQAGNYPYTPPSYTTPIYTTPTYTTPSYTYPTYQNPPMSPWGLSPVINSLSVTSGGQGTSVTVYGANFDIFTTSVRFGATSIVPAINATQTSFTFTVPNVQTGSYPVSVTTPRGASNSLSFNVTGSTSQCGWGYFYPCTQVNITSLSPMSGAVGTTVTVYGNGFSTSNNTVYFGSVSIPNVSSFNGNSIVFTVPFQVTGYGQQVVAGTYPVSVRNAQGQVSNTQNFTVTSSGSGGSAPVVASVTGPTSLSTGTQGTWTLTLNAPYGTYVTTSVRWGDETLYAYAAAAPQSTYVSGQQTVTFTHTYNSIGAYTPIFTVTGPGGSNIASATVNVTAGGGTGALSLTYINPSSARVGTYVTLYGNGFTSYGNDVHFGVGGTKNLSSNGNTISFTIPAWVSPCDFIQSGYTCGAPATQVVPGVYPIYVTNSVGSTNVINFTVTQ